MKTKRAIFLILSIFILAGLVGAAAILSKNFTEIPEFVLNTTEKTVSHNNNNNNSNNSSNNNEEQIKDTDLDHVVYKECECYTNTSSYSGGTKRTMTELDNDSGVFYAAINRTGFWGIKVGFVLDSGKIKSWTYDFEDNKAKHPFVHTSLICMSFLGDEPDLQDFPEVYQDYELSETIESDFEFKIFVYTALNDDVQSFNMIFNLTDSVINVTYGDGTSGNISQSGTVENIVSVNTVSYEHHGERVTSIVDPNEVIVLTISGDEYVIDYYPEASGYSVVSSSYEDANCLAYDTKVRMADNSLKNLGDIEVGDEVLSIDYDTMTLVSRKVIYSGRDESDYEDWITPYYFENVYSDGTIVKQCMRHRLYNLEDEGYKHLFTWTTGEHGYKLDGTNPTLVERRIVNTPQRYARITLEGSNNWFAEGMSTGDSECPSGIVLDHALQRAGE